MSKNLTVKVSKEMYNLIQSRANENRISKIEMATVVFNFGMKIALEELKKEQARIQDISTGFEKTEEKV